MKDLFVPIPFFPIPMGDWFSFSLSPPGSHMVLLRDLEDFEFFGFLRGHPCCPHAVQGPFLLLPLTIRLDKSLSHPARSGLSSSPSELPFVSSLNVSWSMALGRVTFVPRFVFCDGPFCSLLCPD